MMVRPCGNRRDCCATSILAFSVLLAVCAILLFIASQMFANTDLVEAFKPLRDNKETASRGLIIVAAVIFVTGLFGIGAFKIRNKIFMMVFGFLLAGIIVILGGFIAIFGGLANLDSATLHRFCPEENTNLDFEYAQEIQQSFVDIDRLNVLSSFFMCSQVCPCLEPTQQVLDSWTPEKNWKNLSEK